MSRKGSRRARSGRPRVLWEEFVTDHMNPGHADGAFTLVRDANGMHVRVKGPRTRGRLVLRLPRFEA